ncbi:TPA: hypothetical protein N0F65_011657 [Lagenidium giganteum]|uniref:PH domain-containing protein n=1 Tax=Lagenidium giganteum TaxID=4803 RepID=A0AAV2Z7C3_9STRA|nr:TPA: hypothetical protein N0F65_011657 [Lagenidium giganteum]
MVVTSTVGKCRVPDVCIREATQVEHGGAEWLMIDETVGYFVPVVRQRWRLIHVDQSRNVLHYDEFKRWLRLSDVSLVTPVEETTAEGTQRWWMTLQDMRAMQVWILHFPSIDRLHAWIDALKLLAKTTDSSTVFHELIIADATRPKEIRSSISPTSDTILDMTPELPSLSRAFLPDKSETKQPAWKDSRLVSWHTATRLKTELSLTLAGHLDWLGFFGGLGHVGALLGQDDLNVRWVGHVWSNATVGTVSSSALLNRQVSLRVRDVEGIHIQALDFGVGFGVLDQVQDDLGSLLWPLALVTSGTTELALGVTATTTSELGEWHGLLVFEHSLQERLGLGQLHAVDGMHDFAAVHEVHAQVRAAGLGGTLGIFRFLAFLVLLHKFGFWETGKLAAQRNGVGRGLPELPTTNPLTPHPRLSDNT